MRETAVRALRAVAARSPEGGLRAARGLAALTHLLGYGIAEEQIAELVGERGPRALASASRQSWATTLQAEALYAGLQRTPPAYPEILPEPALARLVPPAVLVSFHVGPFAALGAAFERLPGDVLTLMREAPTGERHMTRIQTGERPTERAYAFKQAVNAVRAGGFVSAIVDAVDPSYAIATLEAPLLGGTIRLARGPFALARLSGAPLVPLAARWRGTAVEVVCGEPIAPSDAEAALAAATAGWFDGYLRARPGELSAFLLERITRPPAR